MEPVLYAQDAFVERPWCDENAEDIQTETPKVETLKTDYKDFVSRPFCDEDDRVQEKK